MAIESGNWSGAGLTTPASGSLIPMIFSRCSFTLQKAFDLASAAAFVAVYFPSSSTSMLSDLFVPLRALV